VEIMRVSSCRLLLFQQWQDVGIVHICRGIRWTFRTCGKRHRRHLHLTLCWDWQFPDIERVWQHLDDLQMEGGPLLFGARKRLSIWLVPSQRTQGIWIGTYSWK
jgi:hypothetical protein